MQIDTVPDGSVPRSVRDALAHLAALGGDACTVLGRLPGGLQSGAWLLAGAHGRRRVLKITTGAELLGRRDQTADLVEALVRRGYPTPAWECADITPCGVGYVVSRAVEGTAPTWHTLDLPRLLAAIELQAGIAGPSASTWSDYVMTIVSDESEAMRTLRATGGRTAACADAALAVARRLGPVLLPRRDAVHGDMGLANLLVDAAGRLCIIDIDACGPGTRAIDHAWLYREAISGSAPRSAAGLIQRAGEAVVGADAFRLLVAAACCELLAFQVRQGPGKVGDRQIRVLGACMDSLG